MTVPSTTRKAGPYTGNGSATSFSFAFKTSAAGDIAVVKTSTAGVESTLVLSSDYSVSLNADQVANPGGTITYPISGSPLAVGEKLTITGNVAYSQNTSLPNGGAYNASVVEAALDRITILTQQLKEEIGRAVKVAVSDATDPSALIASLLAAAADAEAAAAAAAASYDDFDDRYLGAKASDPTLDNDGNALITGALYFNTVSNEMRVYGGAQWVVAATAAPVSISVASYNGTGAQTVFTLPTSAPFQEAVEVYISGVSQRPSADFTVAGTALTFTSAPPAGTSNIFVRVLSPIGASSTGAVANGTIYENSRTLTASYTLTDGKSGHAVGPFIIPSGMSLTIPSGERFVIL